uniref:FXNA-like protease n=1 Tax=Acrobeloides nanus TaxID=290746 RepID=A0A914E0V7_9BILA
MSASELRRRQRPVEEILAEAFDESNHLIELQKPKKKKLGFTEWVLIVIFVTVLYAAVVFQDSRLPSVVPDNQTTQFSETRARVLLSQLAALGPRPSGSQSLEIHAYNYITTKLESLQKVVEEKGVNRLEMDVHRPTGCFHLKFLSSFTLCYHKITNILARIGPKGEPTKHSILLNCHFDTLPDTPGATDDAVSCAIMMEVLEILSNSEQPLENDIILLFNGAEENFLQASHGFITQHPWRHTIRAFINLEGTGSGGREILFQTYLDNAPHPHGNVIAQEIFQSGIIPSDTDFRIFRDYGRVSGLDIAYHRNGWVYHTEFDKPELINSGSIQRAGENILAVVRALIRSPYLKQPANFNEGNKWIFYDVVGFFTIYYEVSTGAFFNYAIVLAVILLVGYRVWKRIYTFNELVSTFGHHLLAFLAMALTGVALVAAVISLDLIMLMAFVSYAVMLFFDFFVPVMGRMGNVINPEFIMMPLSLLTALTFVLFTNNLIYISRKMNYLLKCSIALFILFVAILATTRLGVPFKWSEDSPRLRRTMILHAKRSIYNFDGKLKHSDNGLFVQVFDYRGIKDLPDHTFLQGNGIPNCSGTNDEYCQLPYYTAIHELFPPEKSLWVPLPTAPRFPGPLKVSLLERQRVAGNLVNLTLVVKGDVDKMSFHVTPINGYKLKDWSFAPFDEETFGKRQTYFIFLTYGHEAPVDRTFWVLLENENPSPPDPEISGSLEFAVATHYAHGPHQNSETLSQVRNMINTRRQTPHVAVGYWKWAITHIGSISELVAQIF